MSFQHSCPIVSWDGRESMLLVMLFVCLFGRAESCDG